MKEKAVTTETKNETVTRPNSAAADDEALLTEVARLEEKFAENPDNEGTRRELHVARVRAGWKQFIVDTVSGADPRLTIPWVAILEIRYRDEWSEEATGRGTPPEAWLKAGSDILPGGLVKRLSGARLCTDGKWRRDVSVEHYVMAVENLEHLCSVVTRMEDVILYKPEPVLGLMRIQIFDKHPDQAD